MIKPRGPKNQTKTLSMNQTMLKNRRCHHVPFLRTISLLNRIPSSMWAFLSYMISAANIHQLAQARPGTIRSSSPNKTRKQMPILPKESEK
ncbi:hypothetical protein A2625_02215 [candidate division WOR-1 bacterium RIFCSPHIGHO2_01_FULL_53_15]|uniref:Uncharacterized protein n=1 Tax=candidate division WOR-1 bacterium RIFCSPHIGHO2_01_FULL_53_15 TaxID=1802564 RepID=A0A1F4PZL1_UNCSA|nr:MAG: hypothetical protein A2625_02215 [candidate division WOR-1 bacterium RIFCSPHIGHO2_01_FULL_53_15]OGC10780.1 MAG: hypothetical protein A3D23_05295 [candidate division WOR-1 bacterium RIFCSPHIGHO2_02_FULL_53_26]